MRREVTTTGNIPDSEAFLRIRKRLEDDVGGLMELVLRETRQNSDFIPPFWAFARMLFPVAEATGDLLYRTTPSKNLLNLFQNDLSNFNVGYRDVGALVILIYRHSLIHQDELKTLISDETRIFSWGLGFGGGVNHLEVLNVNRGRSITVIIQFDLSQFYKHLLELLAEKSSLDFQGRAGRRYEEWKMEWLPRDPDSISNIEKTAIEEARKLHENWRPIFPGIPQA